MLLIIIILLLIGIGIPLLISFISYVVMKRFYPRRALMFGLIVFVIPYIIFGILIYIAKNPGEKFYQDEFRIITESAIPESAIFEFKKSTYPDFQGEYIFAAAINLSKDDFKNLLSKIRNSKKLIEKMDAGSETYDWIKNQTGNQKYLFYASSNEDANYHFIGFCEDEKTAIIHLIKW